MKLPEALDMARRWTADNKDLVNMPFFHMVQSMLRHMEQQEKDIKQLTDAVRAGMVRNKELLNELARSTKPSK
jgi:hypothetical protein